MGKILKFGVTNPPTPYVNRDVDSLVSGIKLFMDAAKSEATKRAYRTDWANFTAFCENNELSSMPAEPSTLCAYITALAESGRKVSTITRHMTTISQAHRAFRKRSPTGDFDVLDVLKGIKRTIGVAQKKARALVWSDLVKVCRSIRPHFQGKRDKALLLVGWAAALRRSELVALDLSDIGFVAEGMIVNIARSKTDQEGAGYEIGVPFAKDPQCCPTTALKSWIEIARIESGPLFFSIGNTAKQFFLEVADRERLRPRGVNYILGRRLEKAQINTDGYSGHSLRAGFITSASKAGVPEHMIQTHTRHRSVKTMRGYIREGNLFNDNPASVIF